MNKDYAACMDADRGMMLENTQATWIAPGMVLETADNTVGAELQNTSSVAPNIGPTTFAGKPQNAQENMRRGLAALQNVVVTGQDVAHAMYRDGLGWISIVAGQAGQEPATGEALERVWADMPQSSRKEYPYSGGYGILHMAAKRAWESRNIKALLGQSVDEFLQDAVRCIALGIEREHTRDTVQIVNQTPYRTAFLARDVTKPGEMNGDEYWILTDYKIDVMDYKLVNPETQEVIMETANNHNEGADMNNDAILEQAAQGTDFEGELRSCKSFADIKALFEQWFDLDGGSDPDDYKNSKSDYGLKVKGVKARERLNAQAKEIIERVKTPADLTDADREVLLQYSGRGGTSNNSQSEYYTPTHVAEGIWDAMKANGFENGNVLEPSCGAGVFLGTKPQGVVMTANDIDETSSGVARLLNPTDKVTTSPFEQIVIETPDGTFDSCVGNVPFGSARGASMHIDPAYKNEKRLETYFLLRLLDKIKPGGLACLVCPTNIVGNKTPKFQRFRTALSKKAEFLGAHKLPSKTFAAQGTDTVVDVVVFRKHNKELLERLEADEIATETLKQANVYWEEFISGTYWQGEGKKFIMGKYVPKVEGDRWSRETVDGDIDNATMKANLARKFQSRINWELLGEAEPITRNYADGDTRYINGDPYQYLHGEWKKLEASENKSILDRAKFGADSVEELKGLLADNSTALSLTASQAFAAFKAYPELMTTQQRDAVEFAMGQASEETREQVYRGALIGAMIAKMGVDEEGGENVDLRRKQLQESVVSEIEKYGHPSNNPKLTVMGQSSRTFGFFMNAIDTKGNFSPLLAGTLDRTAAKGYKEDSVFDIVSHIYNVLDDGNIQLEDIKAMYKGPLKLETLGDLAGIDGIAITPEGLVLPRSQYCAGDVVKKMAELTEAIANTDDDRLKSQFRKQIDEMNGKIPRVPVEDITFNLQAKWLDKKYIIEFLRQNGYRDATFGEFREYEKEDYYGNIEKREGFVEDFDAKDGEFFLFGPDRRKPGYFDGQFQKYLNGGKITSNDQDTIAQYKEMAGRFENQFDTFCKQHIDIDELAENYNLKFNGYVQPEYDTSKLDIDDIISGDIKPHSYQNQEVRRLSEQGSGICGFGTGLGKSFTALAMAGYNYKHGKAKRTCVVVPSSVLENWYHEANMFYNQNYMRNNVLFVGLEPKRDREGNIVRKPLLDENGKPRTRKDGTEITQDVIRFANSKEDVYEAMWKIPQSNYSLVVMTKEKFQTIPIKPSTMSDYTDEMVNRHLMSEREAQKAADNAAKKNAGRSYADDVHIESLRGKYSDQRTEKKGELPFLEDMGFDSIISDESHFFKNSLSGGENTQGIAYVPNPVTSAIATDMAIKCAYMRKKNGGRGVYGLTATPVTNSPIEIFNMLSLVAPQEDFENMGVHTVDDFVRLFGKIEPRDRSSVSGDIKTQDTLVGFKNLSGLRNLFKKYVNIKTVEDVDDEIHVPNAEEAEEVVPMTEEQASLYMMLRNRAQQIGQKGNQDSIFSVMRDMDRCTTDVDLFWHRMSFVFDKKYKSAISSIMKTLPTAFEYEEKDEITGETRKIKGEFPPKLEENGDTITLIVHEQHETPVMNSLQGAQIGGDEINHPISPKYAKLIENLKRHLDNGGKQIVFTEEKTQHHKIKRILVHNLPITDGQVAIINAEDAKGAELDKISKAYNAGEVKIVIANKKAEVGVNLQKGTTAIHHLTLPWTPASINQRNGRGVRQGNKVDTVQVFYYEGEGTFDGYRRQLLQGKSNWINQLLMGKESNVENADVSADEEMLATFTGRLEEYRERRRQEEERRKNAAKTQLVNDLQRLISVQGSLNTWEARKEEAKRKATSDVEDQKRKIANAQNSGKDEETIKRLKDTLAKKEEKLATIDAKFDLEKKKMEGTKAQVTGLLKQAAKDGKLPYDASLIDNPMNCIVSSNGQLFTVGSYWEVKYDGTVLGVKGDILLVKDTNPDTRKVLLEPFTDANNWQARDWFANSKIDALKPCTVSAAEMNMKRFLAGSMTYKEIGTPAGITKEQFEENVGKVEFGSDFRCVARKDGKIRIVDGSRQNSFDKETMQMVYPEPNNQDFRKAVLQEFLEMKRAGEFAIWRSESFMEDLFGDNYEEELVQFQKNATETEINEMIATAYKGIYDDAFGPLSSGVADDMDRYASILFGITNIKGRVEARFDEAGFDNKNDIYAPIRAFQKAKEDEIRQKMREFQEEKKRKAEEALRSHPNFKEVPGDMADKFRDLGITILYNTEDTTLTFKGRGKSYAAFDRLFMQDINGIGGKLHKMKEILKARYGASFTKDWAAHSGAWWHVNGNTDLQELFDLLA